MWVSAAEAAAVRDALFLSTVPLVVTPFQLTGSTHSNVQCTALLAAIPCTLSPLPTFLDKRLKQFRLFTIGCHNTL